jgi:CMP-N-acetylneuraminic acid synthetase
MIAHSIDAARNSGLFAEVFVCTEDAEIAEVAARHGATVPFLVPEELCGDLVASHVPCQHVAKELSAQGKSFESMLCLQPSSPLRSAEDIRGATHVFLQGLFDFVVSVTPIDPHYFHWAVQPMEAPYWKMYFGTEFLRERPLLPSVHRPNGSIKIANLSALAVTGSFFGDRLGVFETPELRSVHVAEPFDLVVCEAAFATLGR